MTTTEVPHSFVSSALLSDKLKLSRIISVPCGLVLLVSSLILFYLILKYFTSRIHLYFSLLCFTFSQVILVIVLFISPIVQRFTNPHCQTVLVLENLVVILPGYGVLFITTARCICMYYPLTYRKLLDLRVQVVVSGVVVCILTLITCLPLFGFCKYSWRDMKGEVKHCAIESVENNGQCFMFKWILIVFGFILPCLGDVVLYTLIIRALVVYKRIELKLNGSRIAKTKSVSTACSVTEKLAKLHAIGQDAIPWSLVVILFLNIWTTLLWIPKIFLQYGYYHETQISCLLDVVYCFMLFFISLSPLAYILTTPKIKTRFIGLIKGRFDYCYNLCKSGGV